MAHDGAPDRDSYARLQAGLAAALERADRAEVQLRTATEESQRLAGRVELLEQDLADAKRDVAKSREEMVAVTALAATHGARAVELEREVISLREKTYQLGLDLTAMATERDHLTSELSGLQLAMNDMTAARNQLMNQLEEAAKQQSRSAAAATAADDRHKAEMQQLQVRLAATEAECRALHHAKGNMHEDLQRSRAEILALQAQVQEEARQRDEQSSECRRLQRELETATEGLAQAQRLQRVTIAASEELEMELERVRTAQSAQEAELQAAKEIVLRLQDEVRLATERSTDLAGQLQALNTSVRNLEVENLRLADGHATLRVEIEARAAEARAARGEAAELAADRARLLAELQQKPAGFEDDEVSRLREALSASRLEVARLQRELAANDAVLADAESALVALVSEKEGLQQALSVALMSARVAVDTAEELKARAAALTVHEPAAEETLAMAPANEVETMDANGVDQRMMSYLQGLHDGGSTPQSTDSGQEQTSAVAAGNSSFGHASAASSAGATTGVRVGTAAAQVLVARYPTQPTRTTSETGSIVPTHRPEGQTDAWEGLSASGTESSGRETGSGEGPVASAPAARPSLTSLSIASLSLATQAPQSQGVRTPSRGLGASPTAAARFGFSMPGDSAGLAASGTPSRVASLASPVRVTAPSAPNGTLRSSEDFGVTGVSPATVNVATSSGGNVAATAAVPVTVAAPVPDGASASSSTSSALRSHHLPPRSPQSSLTDLHELDNNAPSSAVNLSHGGDMGPRPVGLLPTQSPQPAAVAAAAAKTPMPSRLPAASSALQTMVSAPAPDVYRTPQPAVTSLASPSLLQASAASDGLLGAGSPAAASAGGGGVGGYFSALSGLRGPDTLSSALAGRSAISAEVASTLQSSVYRLPSRVSLVGPRLGFAVGASSASAMDGNERGTSSRPTSVGGTGAGGGGGGGSPMISPRVMMDSRMLSRAVRPSAEALTSPLRPNGIVPGAAAAAEQGALAGSQPTQYGDGVVGIRASGTLTSASSFQHQQQGARQQQSPTMTPMATPAYRKSPSTEPDVGAYPSPFVSGNTASAIASPRTSGAVAAAATSPSPRAAGTVHVAAPSPPVPVVYSFDLLSQRVSKEQPPVPAQPPVITSSPAPSARPSLTLSFARHTTLTQERGLVGSNQVLSGPATSSGEPSLQIRAGDGVSRPHQVREEPPTGIALVNSVLLPPAPSEEDAMLLKRLAAMDDALRLIGAI